MQSGTVCSTAAPRSYLALPQSVIYLNRRMSTGVCKRKLRSYRDAVEANRKGKPSGKPVCASGYLGPQGKHQWTSELPIAPRVPFRSSHL
jgi:hypothetical protein